MKNAKSTGRATFSIFTFLAAEDAHFK